MKGGGIGIRSQYDEKSAFELFMSNSEVTYNPNNQGSTSRVLLYNFTGGVSPYISIENDTAVNQ